MKYITGPLMLIFVPLPAKPPVPTISTPAILPFKTLAMSPSGLLSTSLDFKVDTEYPKAFFSRLIPCAVTTTSSSVLSSCRVTFTLLEFLTVMF